MSFVYLKRPVFATIVFLLSHATALAQGKLDFRMILELPWEDTETIPNEQIVKLCSDILANPDKHPSETVAEALFRRGDAYARRGRLDDAITDFDALCDLKPKAGKARSMRASTLARMGRIKEAIADAREAIALEPKQAHPHPPLGYFFFAQGKHDDALASAKVALDLDPSHARAYYLRALVAEARGELKESLAMVNRYLEQCPLPNLREQDDPYRFRGWLLFRLNRPTDALSNFLLARKLNPSSLGVAQGIHFAYQDCRKWHMAAKAAEQLVKLAPDIPEYHLYHAYALAKTGANREARKSMDEANRVAPPNSFALGAHRGLVYFLLGENEKALECFDDALKFDKDSEPAIMGKAFMLAACSDAKYRDGAQALKLAKRYQDQGKRRGGSDYFVEYLLLADAEAECGNYAEALRLTRKGLETAGPDREHAEFHERIKLFENKKPYRYLVLK